MSGFEEFFKENVREKPQEEYKVSDRFEKNFILKALSEEKHEEIRSCTLNYEKGTLNQNKYAYLLCAETVVYPDFNNAALQDSYSVKSADALIKKMLTAGEFTGLLTKVKNINGFDKSFKELKSEVKNL